MATLSKLAYAVGALTLEEKSKVPTAPVRPRPPKKPQPKDGETGTRRISRGGDNEHLRDEGSRRSRKTISTYHEQRTSPSDAASQQRQYETQPYSRICGGGEQGGGQSGGGQGGGTGRPKDPVYGSKKRVQRSAAPRDVGF